MVKKKPTHRRISSPAGEGEKKVAEGTETREKLPVAVAENPGRKVSSFLTAKQKKKKKKICTLTENLQTQDLRKEVRAARCSSSLAL